MERVASVFTILSALLVTGCTLSTPGRERPFTTSTRESAIAHHDVPPTSGSVAGADVIIRWADRTADPIRVYVDPPSENLLTSDDAEGVIGRTSTAFQSWEGVGIPVRFAFVDDSANAEIVVHYVYSFREKYDGWTTVQWDSAGWIRGAIVQLAMRDPTGRVLSPVERGAIATHEIGHALGLAHAADSTALMWPVMHVRKITAHDTASARQLYTTSPGRRPATVAAQHDVIARPRGR